MTMNVTQTERGFDRVEFVDQYGAECSIQQSSAMRGDEPFGAGSAMLWIGPNDANPRILASKAKELGVRTTETTGWIPYPLSDEVMMTTRMHVDREQVAELVLFLTRWLETGKLSEPDATTTAG
jgi:hypothetical protein